MLAKDRAEEDTSTETLTGSRSKEGIGTNASNKTPTGILAKDRHNERDTMDPRQDIRHDNNDTAKTSTAQDITAKDTDAKGKNSDDSSGRGLVQKLRRFC